MRFVVSRWAVGCAFLSAASACGSPDTGASGLRPLAPVSATTTVPGAVSAGGKRPAPSKATPGVGRPKAAPKKAVPAKPAPKPPVPSGDLAETLKIGKRLQEHYRKGLLVLVRWDREPHQLRQLAIKGYVVTPDGKPAVISLSVLRTLDHLAAHSTPRKPLALLSLYRPPTRPGAREPHGRGMAIDIWAYGGHNIHSRDRKECVEGVVAVLKALPPRSYRLGLPKPPNTDPIALQPPPPRPATWPFFPAPVPVTTNLMGRNVVLPRMENGKFLRLRRGRIRPHVARWENEHAAPLDEIGSPRLKKVIALSRKRGAVVRLAFPDALDHLHLDVVPSG